MCVWWPFSVAQEIGPFLNNPRAPYEKKMAPRDTKVALGDCVCFQRCPETSALPPRSTACSKAVTMHIVAMTHATRKPSGEAKAKAWPKLGQLSPCMTGVDIPTHPFGPVFIFGPLDLSPSQTSFLYDTSKQNASLKHEYQFYISYFSHYYADKMPDKITKGWKDLFWLTV